MAPCIESVFLLDRMCYLHEQVLFRLNVRFLSICVYYCGIPVQALFRLCTEAPSL